METIAQDVRYGVRQLFRQRGSSVVAVLTLAFGIGASTALVSVVDAVMLRPLPYPNPEQLVRLGVVETRPDGTTSRPAPSLEDLRFWQGAQDVFSYVAGSGQAFGGRIAEGPAPERIEVRFFTESYLSMLGVAPLVGRDFTREDMDPGSPLVALLGYGYWQSRFGGWDVIGETIQLEGDLATIVGVLPQWFNASTPVTLPLRIAPEEVGRRGLGSRLGVSARLRPGVSIEQATERVSARMAGWTPSGGGGRPSAPATVRISSQLDAAVGRARTTVSVLAGAVGLVLLLACVNVAGLLLARGAARQSELAVRSALGASRARLARQLLTENVVLAVFGATLGVLMAWLALDAIVANIPLSLPTNAPVTVNLAVLSATVALLVPTVLLFGLVPAIRLSRVRPGSALARVGRQRGSGLSRRGGQTLIATEVALAVVLVAGAGLMIRSYTRLTGVDLGFTPTDLLTMDVLPLERTAAAQEAYYEALLQRVRAIPAVQSAGIVDIFSLGAGARVTSVQVGDEWHQIMVFRISPGYLETIGARLVEGRWPTAGDRATGFRGVVINESAGREMFPDGTALNRQFTRAESDGTPWTVIGVLDRLRHGGPLGFLEGYPFQAFFPLTLSEFDLTAAMTVVVRASGDASDLPNELRRVAQSIGPRVLVERIRTGDALFADSVVTPRRRLVLLSLLGGLGLVLGLVGVFGMTAYAVARRTTEIGVRMAFGARPAQVVGAVLRDSMVPVGLGAAAGLGAAVLATRVIESFLFETSPTDPPTLAAVAVTLGATACLAALVPALRAAAIDPMSSLRAE